MNVAVGDLPPHNVSMYSSVFLLTMLTGFTHINQYQNYFVSRLENSATFSNSEVKIRADYVAGCIGVLVEWRYVSRIRLPPWTHHSVAESYYKRTAG